MNTTTLKAILSGAVIATLPMAFASCGSNSADKKQDPQETTDNSDKRPVIDKSADSTLQAMIKNVAPEFKKMEYKDSETGKTLVYNLYTPKNIDTAKKYPLVMFIADASTVGEDATTPLTQGYGALVWATEEAQAKNPCYVLVPQLPDVAINDDYKTSAEAEIVVPMLNSVAEANNVDANRIYATGQSMGGMLSMYYNVKYPDLFAASIFVDCLGDTASFDALAKHKFVYFVAGNEGKAQKCIEPLENAARKVGAGYTYSEWSAQLPEAEQSAQAATMLEKGEPINIFQFEPKSVLPADGKGSEHMYSFDYAYRIQSVRDWLFNQSK